MGDNTREMVTNLDHKRIVSCMDCKWLHVSNLIGFCSFKPNMDQFNGGMVELGINILDKPTWCLLMTIQKVEVCTWKKGENTDDE